jgi:hypothetical protein
LELGGGLVGHVDDDGGAVHGLAFEDDLGGEMRI